MVTYIDNILDSSFRESAETIRVGIDAFGKIISNADADVIFKKIKDINND